MPVTKKGIYAKLIGYQKKSAQGSEKNIDSSSLTDSLRPEGKASKRKEELQYSTSVLFPLWSSSIVKN